MRNEFLMTTDNYDHDVKLDLLDAKAVQLFCLVYFMFLFGNILIKNRNTKKRLFAYK
jgi:hypothetical protein